MKLEQSFQVRAPVERVWDTLVDIERVAPCLPGAEITEAGDDGTYRGTFTVKLGPTTAAYRGELRMEEADDSAHRAVMRASGQDKRGQGSAKATIVSSMSADGDTTRVDVETDFTITGRLARFGRGGMIKDISNRLLGEFAKCLQQTLAAQPAADAGASPSSAGEGVEEAKSPAELEGKSPAEVAGSDVTERAEPPPAPALPTQSGPAQPPAAAAPPVKGFSLLFGVLRDRVTSWVRRLRRRR
jgi:uncharacterized protein